VEITEVRIKLMEEAGDRLQAFCSITFDDCFVVRDLKIIEGTSGPFVAMPSRKLTARCPQCGCKNHLRAAYCNQCGLRLKDDRAIKDDNGRAKLYADIAHPINSGCREVMQERVIAAFLAEVERSKSPDYVSSYDDFDHEDYLATAAEPVAPRRKDVPRSRSQSTAERTHVEPAEPPRGPHTVPSQHAPAQQGAARRGGATYPAESPRDFGAGIF